MNNLNNNQKIFLLFGITSFIVFIMVGFISGDWLDDPHLKHNLPTLIPLVISIFSFLGFYLFQDKK